MAANDEESDFENERVTVGVRWNLPDDEQKDGNLGENTCKWQKAAKERVGVGWNLSSNGQRIEKEGKNTRRWQTIATEGVGVGLNLPNDEQTDETSNENIRKWHNVVNQAVAKRKSSWELIDGSKDAPDWSFDDGYWRWIKRLLTIGNVGVILLCFCLLAASSFVCFRR